MDLLKKKKSVGANRKELPESICTLLKCSKEDVKCFARADIDADMKYADTWLVMCSDVLYFVRGGKITEQIPVFSIKNAKVENLVSISRMSADVNETPRILCTFSISQSSEMFDLIAAVSEACGEAKKDENADEGGKRRGGRGRKGGRRGGHGGVENVCPDCGSFYIDEESKICPKCTKKAKLLFCLFTFATDFRGKLALAFLFMCLSSVIALVPPYLSGTVLYDMVLSNKDTFFGFEVFGMIGLFVLTYAFIKLAALINSIIYGRLVATISPKLIHTIRSRTFSAISHLSLGFFSSRQTGSLMVRVNSDAQRILNFFIDGAPYFIVNSITILGILVAMFAYSWQLALIIVIPAALFTFLMTFTGKYWDKLWHRRFVGQSRVSSILNDVFTGIRVVKAFSKEEDEGERFSKASGYAATANINLGVFNSSVFPLFSMLLSIASTALWGFGGWMVINGNLEFGALVTLTGYLGMLFGPIEFMVDVVRWWSDCSTSAHRIFSILDAVPDIMESKKAQSMPNIRGEIELRNVTFAYEKNKPVIKNISFKVEAGKTLGIVGKTGAGKSTITNLIMRLYDATEGEVFIDGVNVQDIKIDDLRGCAAVVSQEIFLFSGSIMDNIRYARPDATDEEVIAAAKAANAHDFIVHMASGYETKVGEGSRSLSGGERQRISIARALLCDPKILIMDEATASMDTETERLIHEALTELVRGRTTILIAHRLSTLRDADYLITIENGKLVEEGTHEELLEKKGEYYKLYNLQNEAYKNIGIGIDS